MSECCPWRRAVLKSAAVLFSLALTWVMLSGCETTKEHDPRDGPQEDISHIPWNRQESWEGNPYGAFFQGTR